MQIFQRVAQIGTVGIYTIENFGLKICFAQLRDIFVKRGQQRIKFCFDSLFFVGGFRCDDPRRDGHDLCTVGRELLCRKHRRQFRMRDVRKFGAELVEGYDGDGGRHDGHQADKCK